MSLYGQEPEVRLLISLLARLEHRSVVDIGAERGAFAEELLCGGADQLYAIEPEPRNAAALRDRFRDPRVKILELAATDTDRELSLHLAVDASGDPIAFGHTVLDRPATDEIAWEGTALVPGRSLSSLVRAGELPTRVGMVKIDTEGHDLAVVAGMGELDCDVVMVEHWVELPRSLGACPWSTEEMVAALRDRGFSHFAFVVHRGEFVTLQWDDGTIPAGHMGNLVFIHDRVLDQLLPAIVTFASWLAEQAVATGEQHAAEAKKRSAVIESLERERTILSQAARQRLETIEALEQGAAPTNGGSATGSPDLATALARAPLTQFMSRPPEFWPPANAVWSPGPDEQWSDGNARCTAVAICDEDGGELRAAHQGQPVHLLSEFELTGVVGVPSGWFELRDASGLVVHGNRPFQEATAVRLEDDGDARLRCRYVVQLDVAPGEYSIAAGLSSADAEAYLGYWRASDSERQWPTDQAVGERAGRYRHVGLPEERFEPHVREHCRVESPDTIVVGFDAGGRLAHTGLVGLPGTGWTTRQPPSETRRNSSPSGPTVVHATHYKAGSQWIYAILRACVPDRVVAPDARSGHFRYWPPEPGKVYPTVYLTRQQFDAVATPPDCRVFVVVRDLRDTLISSYFSLVKTHGMADRPSLDLRRLLGTLSVEQGLLYLIDHWLAESARIQLSWLEAGQPLIRYEDLLENDVEVLEEVLLDRCELGVPRDEFHRIVVAHRFQELTGGRDRGTEDQTSHIRKGIAGDWRNHFTEPVARAFKARYGGLLVATGYEQDLDW
jgi:FkbM family methyltransferase